jgi:S-adenosylmethionine synthetase
VTHVGKIYNVIARQIAEATVAAEPGVAAAQCLMVSQIGSPVTRPAVVEVKLAAEDSRPIHEFRRQAEDIVGDCLRRIPRIIDGLITGAISVM